MRLLTALVALAACGGALAQRVLPISFARQKAGSGQSGLEKRARTYSQSLNNNLTGGGYYAQVSVGTPPQPVSLILDTGSSDVWILASNATLCSSQRLQTLYGYCLNTYDASDSSTASLVSENTFSIQYVDGSGAEGNYIKDTIDVGGANISALQMGLAINTTIDSGLMGIGFPANEATKTQYPNLIELFVNQGLISSQAYSLYLDDLDAQTGTILFGGLDKDKFIGELKAIDILPTSGTDTYTSFSVTLSSFATTAGNGTVANYSQTVLPIPVVLDSGTTLTYLPYSVTDELFDAFGAVDDSQSSGLVYVDCDYLNDGNLTFDFQFAGGDGPTVRVPVDEVVLDNIKGYEQLGLVVPSNLPFQNVCSFGIQGTSERSGYYLLGDTFLRSAYVVYDLSAKQIALAQPNLNSTDSNIVEISQSSGIPLVTGVASQVSATQTATGALGTGTAAGGGTQTTGGGGTTATGTGASSSNKGNAAGRTAPTPSWEALAVVMATGLFGLVGAGIVLL
ncbi:aspartic peptidase domain-containing protein [Xylariaceae sp. FL0804]|nr:aspartic peptidase domain-containing protein [Xylariaceae sp. FL0804]